MGQWVLVGLSRHDNLFGLRLEQGGGSREVQARLGNRREIMVHPASVTVGNGPNAGDEADFRGERGGSGGLTYTWFWTLVLCPPSSCRLNRMSTRPSGCLRDVRFNGQALPLDGQSRDLVAVLERRGVAPGCGSDACRGQPCRSPLRCVDLWRKHQCR